MMGKLRSKVRYAIHRHLNNELTEKASLRGYGYYLDQVEPQIKEAFNHWERIMSEPRLELMVKGVTFDFGGTLALGDLSKEDFRNRLLEYLRSLGLSGGKTRLSKARNGMLERLVKARSHNREIRLEDLYQGMLSKLGLHPERECIDYIHQLYIDFVMNL